MSDLGETFKAWREEKQKKKEDNLNKSEQILIDREIPYEKFTDYHFLVNKEIDFWASTGKWIVRKNKKHGRGVFKLIDEIKK